MIRFHTFLSHVVLNQVTQQFMATNTIVVVAPCLEDVAMTGTHAIKHAADFRARREQTNFAAQEPREPIYVNSDSSRGFDRGISGMAVPSVIPGSTRPKDNDVSVTRRKPNA